MSFAVLGPNLFEALRRGQVAAGMVQEPALTLIVEAGGKVLFNLIDIADTTELLGGAYEFMGVAYRAEEREERLEQMRKLARALSRGLAALQTAPVSDIIEAPPAELLVGGDAERFDEIVSRYRGALYPETVEIDVDAARRVVEALPLNPDTWLRGRVAASRDRRRLPRRSKPMPEKRPEVLEFLLTRRSRPAKTLGQGAPDRAELETLLTAASRTPDHGKLVPWRFLVLADRERRERLVEAAARRLAEIGHDPAKVDKDAGAFRQGGVVVAVVSSPRNAHIPRWEQEFAAPCVCLSLLNAALASGWGANWLTGPLARDEAFLTEALGCAPGETVAGFVHIGDETVAPAERDRPDVPAITTWL